MATTCDVRRALARVTTATVLGLVLGCTSDPPPAEPGPVTVEFRRAETTPEPGLVGVRWPQTGQTIYLHSDAELIAADIAEAIRGLGDDDRYEILIRFTKAGVEKMARLYETHRGKPIAILVNGRCVCGFTLLDRIDKWSSIAGGFTAEEVDRILDGINRR